jgi:hypothetical protein
MMMKQTISETNPKCVPLFVDSEGASATRCKSQQGQSDQIYTVTEPGIFHGLWCPLHGWENHHNSKNQNEDVVVVERPGVSIALVLLQPAQRLQQGACRYKRCPVAFAPGCALSRGLPTRED